MVLSMTLLMVGCSSNPVEQTSYYLLNSLQQQASQHTKENNKVKTIVIKMLELPDYLNQPLLVMQLADHKLHYAKFHMWAEPLKAGLGKSLAADLNQTHKRIQFVSHRRKSSQKEPVLYVEVDFFHPSSDSTVTLSGHYWLEGDSQQAFYFQQLLTQDGYPHAVSQMRGLVKQLAEQVLQNGV